MNKDENIPHSTIGHAEHFKTNGIFRSQVLTEI